jgi:hypothetical protein
MPVNNKKRFMREDQLEVSGYDQVQKGGDPMKTMRAPGFLGRIKAAGPPPYHTFEAEAQEMAILGMLSMPEEFDPVPYSDQFSTERIYTKSITQREQAGWQDQPDDPAMNNALPTEFVCVSFRGVGSLWRRFLKLDPNRDNEENTMVLKDTETRSTDEIRPDDNFSGQMNFNIAEPGPGITYKPHGTTLVCGRTLPPNSTKFANASWVWIDAVPDPAVGLESRLTATWPGAIAADCLFQIYRWNGGKFTVVGAIGMAAGDTTDYFPLTVSDYYTIFYLALEPIATDNFASVGVTITTTSYCSQLCHIQVKEAYKNISQLGPGCTRAGSLRMTEMAAPLNIQGECAVACTREVGTWYSMFSTGAGGSGSIFKQVVNYREAYLGPLRLGGYSYHLPKEMSDFESHPFCDIDYETGTIKDVWFDIGDQSTVNIFAARTMNTGTRAHRVERSVCLIAAQLQPRRVSGTHHRLLDALMVSFRGHI